MSQQCLALFVHWRCHLLSLIKMASFNMIEIRIYYQNEREIFFGIKFVESEYSIRYRILNVILSLSKLAIKEVMLFNLFERSNTLFFAILCYRTLPLWLNRSSLTFYFIWFFFILIPDFHYGILLIQNL